MKAVIFIDVQNDFLRSGKLQYAYPNEDNFPKILEFAETCVKDTDCRLYATRDTHDSNYLNNTLEGKNLPVEHCIEGTYGWMLDSRLNDILNNNVIIVNKQTFGSYDLVKTIYEDFNETYQYSELHHCNIKCRLKTDKKLDEIVLCGYDLGICVISNALLLRAKFPDVKITIKKDLCGCLNEDTFNAALTVAKCCQINVD